ncbi:Ig-like domain-containing protein [Deinococcus peraridilitoris]|nr:Ig-like domain-containing protein [Deinococcus peraridilitoris]
MHTHAPLKRTLLGISLALTLMGCGGGPQQDSTQNPPPGNSGPPLVIGGRPLVTDIVTSNGKLTNVPRNTVITANISLPTPGVGVDANTLTGNVRLYRADNQQLVPGVANTDGAGGTITFTPQPAGDGLLDAETDYVFEIREGLKDENGAAFVTFTARFRTGTEPQAVAPPVSFTAQQVYPPRSYSNADAPIASLSMSPYGTQLYGVTLGGQVMRWKVDAVTGTLSERQVLNLGDLRPDLAGRAIIGLAFEPPKENQPQVLWISHNDPVYSPDGSLPRDFSGAVSRLLIRSGSEFGPENVTFEDYVVGLPRSIKDHLTNSLAFGPDKKLYVSQSSNTSTGAPDTTWNPGGIHPERLLNAAVLQIDTTRDVSGGPIDVQTEPYDQNLASPGNYNPYAAGSPVKIFADGVRNAYDLVWHSNGSLYLPTNGGASGGSTPGKAGVPALSSAPTQKDFLFRTTLDAQDRNLYFGHPVEKRGHFVLNGGNPTAVEDPAEVVDDAHGRKGYPVGTLPDPNYRLPAYEFGYNRSPNGVVEYKSDVFNGRLKGKLLVVEYSGGQDIVVLTVDERTKNIRKAEQIGIELEHEGDSRLTRPLDLVEDPRNGNLYVAELVVQPGQNQAPKARIRLLRPLK